MNRSAKTSELADRLEKIEEILNVIGLQGARQEQVLEALADELLPRSVRRRIDGKPRKGGTK